jgi:DNA polymerase III alpha subunit (gram-positive type)
MSTRPHQGIYVSIDIVEKHKQWFHDLFKTKLCIFHNSKFDTNFMETEMGFEFPKYEDTMLATLLS